MKISPLAVIFSIPLLFTACVTHCDVTIPADMAAFVPNNHGKSLLFVNEDGDTVVMEGGWYSYEADEELESCSKCLCEASLVQYYHLKKDSCEVAESHMTIECVEKNIFWLSWNVSGFIGKETLFAPTLGASFDSQGHFLSRNFGDTIILTSENPSDTAILVKGLGPVYINGYKRVPGPIQ